MKDFMEAGLDLASRTRILASFGAQEDVLRELLAYNRNVFERLPEFDGIPYPLPDEPFVSAWIEYLRKSGEAGILPVLKMCLRHLNYPVQAGISQSPFYKAVILRGEPVKACPLATGLPLRDPLGIKLRLQPTIAGRVPIISVRNRSDFEQIMQALLNRNEPMPVAPAMGAVMVAGYNNWERIEQHKLRWLQSAPAHDSWTKEFKSIVPRKSLYQDRFIVVSNGHYSGVSADDVKLGEEEWLRLSLDIRTFHECTHYATKRLYGLMRNNLMDEIIADTMGLVCTIGTFRKDWFLCFMGLEQFPHLNPEGRLMLYRGDPPLSDDAFLILQTMLVQAAENMERLLPLGADMHTAPVNIIEQLTISTLESLTGLKRIQSVYEIG